MSGCRRKVRLDSDARAELMAACGVPPAVMGDGVMVNNRPASPCWIGLFDILGFKDLHERLSHADVGSIVQEALLRAPLLVGRGLGIHVYADTILIYPDGDLPLSTVLNRMIFTGRFLIAGAALQNLPMRGAITKGDFGLSPLDFYGTQMGWNIWGKALIRAGLLEQGQNWHGGMIDLDVELDESERHQIEARTKVGDLVDYSVPLHDDAPKARVLALNWTTAFGTKDSAMLQHIQTFAEPKRRNTLAFFDAMADTRKH